MDKKNVGIIYKWIVYLLACLFSQLHAAVQNHTDVDSVGLHVGSSLLSSLKQRVVNLASSSGVLPTIQVCLIK